MCFLHRNTFSELEIFKFDYQLSYEVHIIWVQIENTDDKYVETFDNIVMVMQWDTSLG